MSNLIAHAQRELMLAGMYDADCDYGPGTLANAVLPLIAVFSTQDHSGMSASIVIDLFTKLARFQRLSALTDASDEWMIVEEKGINGERDCWQSRRQSSCFSHDGGKTFYDINEKRQNKNSMFGFVLHESKHVEQCLAEEKAHAECTVFSPTPPQQNATNAQPPAIQNLHTDAQT